MEQAFRQLQEEQGEAQPEGGRGAEQARGDKAASPGSPAPTSDASGETEGEDGLAGDTKRVPQPKASQWANLNRKEQELARKQQEFVKQKAELEAATQALRKGKTNTWEALKALGFEDKKAFLEHIAKTGGEASPEQQKIAELEAWKERQESQIAEREKLAKEEAQANEYRSQVDAYKKGIAQYVKQSEKWKDTVVALDGNEQAVFQVMQDHYLKEGEELTYDEAIEQVNTGMESELQVALNKLAQTARGRAIMSEFASKSLPDALKRGKSTARTPGISNTTIARTEAAPQDALSLDEAIEQNAAWLNSRVGGRRR